MRIEASTRKSDVQQSDFQRATRGGQTLSLNRSAAVARSGSMPIVRRGQQRTRLHEAGRAE